MATITEDYVSFEIAKLLKEKGFGIEEETRGYYPIKGDATGRLMLGSEYHHNTSQVQIAAPTLQMAIKWLREVHNMYYEILLVLGDKAEKYGDLQLGIYQLNSSGSYVWKDWIYADTYVELYENYIKYCLENLI